MNTRLGKGNSRHLSWHFSAIYASNDFHTRLSLWNNLYYLSKSADIEWLVMGDFNEILHASEKLRGIPSIEIRPRTFGIISRIVNS